MKPWTAALTSRAAVRAPRWRRAAVRTSCCPRRAEHHPETFPAALPRRPPSAAGAEGPRLARRPPRRRRAACPAAVLAELNPDELVNADLKLSLAKQHRARNQAELPAETRRFFRKRQRQPHIVRGYFGGPHVRYGLDENLMIF